MPLRPFLQIWKNVIRIILYVAVAGVILFFALTRTQVGRDELRKQIEQQFEKRYAGSLKIGNLTGNLVNDLFADDVYLVGPEGKTIAFADSLIIRPNWQDFFKRRVSIGTLKLIRPHIHLVRNKEGKWNIEEALEQLSRDTLQTADPWSFTSTDVQIIDGTVITDNRGDLLPIVEQGYLFNFADTQLDSINTSFTVELRSRLKLVDVSAFTAHLNYPDFAIDLLQGQMVLEDGRVNVNSFQLTAGRTHLDFSGSVSSLKHMWTDSLDTVHLDVDIQPSRVDHTRLKDLFPFLPTGDETEITARVNGPISKLTIENLAFARGETIITGNGLLTGLPDRLGFDVEVLESKLKYEDLQAVLPGTDLPDFSHLDVLTVALSSTGTFSLDSLETGPFNTRSTLSVRGTAGGIEGQVSVMRETHKPIEISADLNADTLNLGRVFLKPNLHSRLNGRFMFEGLSTDIDSLNGHGILSLRSSRLAGRYLDTLQLDLTAAEGSVSGFGFASQGSGFASAIFSAVLPPYAPDFRLDLTTSNLDVGPLLRIDSLQSHLFASLSLQGSGPSWDQLQGEAVVRFDSSEFVYGETSRVILPHESSLAFAPPGTEGPQFLLEGDLASIQVHTDASPRAISSLAALWGDALAETVRREYAKPYHRAMLPADQDTVTSPPVTIPVSLDQLRLRNQARQALSASGIDSTITLDARLNLHRSDILNALLPFLPSLAADLETRLHLTAGADELALSGIIRADSLRFGSVMADSLTSELQLSGNLDNPLQETLSLSLEASASKSQIAGQTVRAPHLVFDHHARSARLLLSATPGGRIGPFETSATLDLLPDRNRLGLRSVRFSAEDYVWINEGTHVIDLYEDAGVIHSLTLVNREADSQLLQRVNIYGVISSAPEDTLFAEAENINLHELSQLTSLKESIGGMLNGRIALTGGLYSPELTGSLHVDALSFDNRLLGRVDASSTYIPGGSDIALQAAVSPVTGPVDSSLTTIDGHPLVPEDNLVEVTGTFRLPRYDEENDVVIGSVIDLEVQADRADLFFFEYLFPTVVSNVNGYATGHGTIQGSFRVPVFNASFEVVDGSFDIPTFGLNYNLSGPVSVDHEGIKVDGVQVSDASGGKAAFSGAILFNNYEYFSFDLTARIQNLQIIDVNDARDLAFYGNIRASALATLTGPVYQAMLRSANVETTPDSEIFIPLTTAEVSIDPGYIIFADSTGQIPDLNSLVRRENLLAQRPKGEREFLEGMEMDLNIFAPPGSTVHLVIDPLLGDAMNAVGSGRIQLQRTEGEFLTFGSFDVRAGDYLFTAGDVFFRRFLIEQGSITWDGDPTNAQLNVWGSYRTRASRAGLPGESNFSSSSIPVEVRLHITGRVSTPVVDLTLAIDRRDRDVTGNYNYEGLETVLNEPDRSTEYATSVLLTNTFLLTASSFYAPSNEHASTRTQFAFNSVSQLVASQINRYLNQALPNVDFSFGLQGERAQDLDVSYGVALRLLDERLIIRGQGVYQNEQEIRNRGEFAVEIKLSPAVSVEVFYRREGDIVSDAALTNTTGAGLSYQTEFTTWRKLVSKIIYGPNVKDAETDDQNPGT